MAEPCRPATAPAQLEMGRARKTFSRTPLEERAAPGAGEGSDSPTELRVGLGRGPGTSPCRNSISLEQLCHTLPPGTEQSPLSQGLCTLPDKPKELEELFCSACPPLCYPPPSGWQPLRQRAERTREICAQPSCHRASFPTAHVHLGAVWVPADPQPLPPPQRGTITLQGSSKA